MTARTTASSHFADDVILRLRRLGHPLCVGLDPHLERIPPLFRIASMRPGDPRTADAVAAFLTAVLALVAERVAVVKPQIAFFEQLGLPGMETLAAILHAARDRGLLALLDAKRGDVGSTAAAYAAAYLGPEAPFAADALTVSPYLGLDALEPCVDGARRNARGLFVLVKTSNPGSGDFQDRRLEGGRPLYEAVADALAETAEAMRGPETGWSSLGAVVGATYPEEAVRLRERLPRSLFLVPGYGAQGGGARDAVAGFLPGPEGPLEGGLVSSSRAILFPPGSDTEDARTWERAVDEALARAIEELGEAVAG